MIFSCINSNYYVFDVITFGWSLILECHDIRDLLTNVKFYYYFAILGQIAIRGRQYYRNFIAT